MSKSDFVLKSINLEKLDKTKDLEIYLSLFSRFVTAKSFDVENVRIVSNFEKFEVIKNDIIVLAKIGNLKALSFYLEQEKFENLDKTLILMAKDIENRAGEKSPEEWEVIANLHLNDKAYVIVDDSIDTVKKLKEEVKNAWYRYDEFKNQYDHCRYFDPFEEVAYSKKDFENLTQSTLNRWFWLSRCLKDTNYISAIKQAQVGYFMRYSKHQDALDINSFLELKKAPLNSYVEYDTLEKIAKVKSLSNYDLGKIIKKQYKANKTKNDFFDDFAFVRTMDLLSCDMGLCGTLFHKGLMEKVYKTANSKTLSLNDIRPNSQEEYSRS